MIEHWTYSDYFLLAISCMIGTYSCRLFPFLFAKYLQGHDIFQYLNKQLPASIMIILATSGVITTKWQTYPFALPEILAAILALIIHHLFKQTLISLIFSTCFYMFLLVLF